MKAGDRVKLTWIKGTTVPKSSNERIGVLWFSPFNIDPGVGGSVMVQTSSEQVFLTTTVTTIGPAEPDGSFLFTTENSTYRLEKLP